MTAPDSWARRAREEGYRSRAAYKLRQLDEQFDLLDPGRTVVDLGAAPGGWLQVACERVGADGAVIGIDRRSIEPLERTGPTVHRLQGDVTDPETAERVTELGAGPVDVVLSDMAPDMSGEYELDHARSVHLASAAAALARDVLAPGGDLVIKVFEGRDLASFKTDLEEDFEYVATASPRASRPASSEVYLVARGFLTAPVRPGDRLSVEIVDVGNEGDGVAKVEGYTLFVPDGAVGETVEVEIVKVTPRFGFAEVTG